MKAGNFCRKKNILELYAALSAELESVEQTMTKINKWIYYVSKFFIEEY